LYNVVHYHDDAYGHFMKTERLSEFKEAVELDKKIRTGAKNIKDNLYLHKSCKPLDEVEFDKKENARNKGVALQLTI
jgi:hypothetical protein